MTTISAVEPSRPRARDQHAATPGGGDEFACLLAGLGGAAPQGRPVDDADSAPEPGAREGAAVVGGEPSTGQAPGLPLDATGLAPSLNANALSSAAAAPAALHPAAGQPVSAPSVSGPSAAAPLVPAGPGTTTAVALDAVPAGLPASGAATSGAVALPASAIDLAVPGGPAAGLPAVAPVPGDASAAATAPAPATGPVLTTAAWRPQSTLASAPAGDPTAVPTAEPTTDPTVAPAAVPGDAPTPADAAPAPAPDAPPAGTLPAETLPAAAPAAELRRTDAPAPAAAPAGPTPAPPAQQVAQLLGPVLEGPDGAYSLSLQLYPEELGAVQVEVLLRGGEISLSLQATDDVARDTLRGALADLRAQLEAGGLTAGSLSVADGRADQAPGDRPAPRHGRPTGSTGADGADAPTTAVTSDPDAALDVRI